MAPQSASRGMTCKVEFRSRTSEFESPEMLHPLSVTLKTEEMFTPWTLK